jgi:nitrogen regulatory protein PII
VPDRRNRQTPYVAIKLPAAGFCFSLLGGLQNSMKLITAIIKPFRLEEVREALMQAGVQGMTVTEVRGFGRQQGQAEAYRGAEHNLNLVPKLQIEVVVDDDDMLRVTDAIAHAAHTGTVGDGKIFISSIANAVRIRTGDIDQLAL